MDLNTLAALSLFALAAAVSLAYWIRVSRHGRARFSRVDRQGGSALLSLRVMEMFYWAIQPVGRGLVRLGAHPNHISWASLVLGVAAGLELSRGAFGTGAILAAVSALCDALDGLVARERRIQSDAGEVLDAAVDRYTEFAFLGGLAVYYRESPFLILLALSGILGSFMVSYSTAKAEAMQAELPKGGMRRPERAAYMTLGAALSPIAIAMLEPGVAHPVAWPMVAATLLVSAASNWSAIQRMRYLARLVEQPRRAPVGAEIEARPAEASATLK